MHRKANVADDYFNPIRRSKIAVSPNRIVSDIRDDHSQITKLRQISLLPYSHKRKHDDGNGNGNGKLEQAQSNLSRYTAFGVDFENFKKYVISNTGSNNTEQISNIFKLSSFKSSQAHMYAALHCLFIEGMSPKPICFTCDSAQLLMTAISNMVAKKASIHGKQFVTIAVSSSGNSNGKPLQSLLQDQVEDCIFRVKAVYSLKPTITFHSNEKLSQFGVCGSLKELYKVLDFVSYLTKHDKDVPSREFVLGIFIDDICLLEDSILQDFLDEVDAAPIPTFVCGTTRSNTLSTSRFTVLQELNKVDFETYLAIVKLLLTIPLNKESSNAEAQTKLEDSIYGDLWNERIATLLDNTNSKLWKIVHSSSTSSEPILECMRKIHNILENSDAFQPLAS